MNQFAEGMIVSYDNLIGIIGFIGNQYMVFNVEPTGVGVLIFREDWKNIELVSGNLMNRK